MSLCIALWIGTSAAGACGRSEISDAEFSSLPRLPDATSGELESSTAEPSETGTQPGDPCPGVTLFRDGFEDRQEEWGLDSLWAIEQVPLAHAGRSVLRGFWHGHDVGCSVSSEAVLLFSFDLRDVQTATLEFRHRGEACEADTLKVAVRDETARRTVILDEPIPMQNAWTRYRGDLSPWRGSSDVRIILGFENICGDRCGVDWMIDELLVCATR